MRTRNYAELIAGVLDSNVEAVRIANYLQAHTTVGDVPELLEERQRFGSEVYKCKQGCLSALTHTCMFGSPDPDAPTPEVRSEYWMYSVPLLLLSRIRC